MPISQSVEQVPPTCASCGLPLAGRYCAHCGEKVLDPAALTVRHFLTHTLLRELFDLDGKLWRTLLNLVRRPGFLAAEYSAGRRRLYINPVRLLITAILAYALVTQGGLLVTLTIGRIVLSVAPTAVPAGTSVAETVRRIDRFGVLSSILEAKEKSADITSEAVREKFHSRLNGYAQPLSFANVFLLALALYFFFRRRRALLVDHLAFSMHFVSFVLFSSLALKPGVRLLEIQEEVGIAFLFAVSLWQFSYLAIAIRKFYLTQDAAPGWPRLTAIAAALLIYILNSVFLTGVQILGGAIALRSI